MSESLSAGSRYIDKTTNVEVLCIKAGVGPLSIDGREMTEMPSPSRKTWCKDCLNRVCVEHRSSAS